MSNEKFILSVGFSRPHKWKPLAWLIMLIEGLDSSHTFITWKNTRIKRRKIFEAVGAGTRELKNTTFRAHNRVVELYEFEVSADISLEEAEILVEQYSIDVVGTKYGFKALCGLAWMRLANFAYRAIGSKKRSQNPFKDGKYSQVCVEAGADLLQKITKLKLPGDIEDYGIKEYRDFVKSHGRKVSQDKIDRINQKS